MLQPQKEGGYEPVDSWIHNMIGGVVKTPVEGIV